MSNTIQIAVEGILEGMFIAELDIPWNKSGFMLQGFIATADDIEKIKSKCAWVLVSKQHSVSGLFEPELVAEFKIIRKNKVREVAVRTKFFLELKTWLPNLKITNSFSGVRGWLSGNSASRSRAVSGQRQFTGMPANGKDAQIKYAAIFSARTLRARKKFNDDETVTKIVVDYQTTSDLSAEFIVAQNTVAKLNTLVGSRLFGDVSNSYVMDVVMNETKESVGDIVDSMISNPDAMRLVDDLHSFDNLSYKHAVDVCILMIAFGREMKLPKEILVELGLGGLLHDIGEVKPPNGTQVKVSNIAMYSIYKEHVEDGIKLVEKSNYSEIVKSIIAEHHERYDGTGYPRGLGNANNQQKKISMYGLMIGIVDSYVSMVAARSLLQPVSPNTAMAYIVKHAGTHFDTALVDVFSQVIGVYPVGSYVELATGEIGLVIKQNRVWRLKPVVQVVTDKRRKKVSPYFIDLLTRVEFSIKKEALFDGKRMA